MNTCGHIQTLWHTKARVVVRLVENSTTRSKLVHPWLPCLASESAHCQRWIGAEIASMMAWSFGFQLHHLQQINSRNYHMACRLDFKH